MFRARIGSIFFSVWIQDPEHRLWKKSSLSFLKNFIIFFRFMHLLPIPFIAILLISFGISTLLVHLKLDTSSICFQVIKVGNVGLKGL